MLGIWLLAAFVLGLAGCKSTGQKTTATQKQRQETDEKAAKLLVLAQDAFHHKAYTAALTLADSVEQLAPELADVDFLRGLIYSQLRRYPDAEAAYKRVLSRDPYYQGAWMNLGSTALRQSDVRTALAYYRKELSNYPSAAVLHQIGRVYAKLGKPDSARIVYEEALQVDSTFATVYLRLAEIYKEEGEIDKAVAYTRKGLALQPDNLNYRYFMGSLQLLGGRLGDAIANLRQVVEKQPWHYWANYNLGQALVRSGKRTEGEKVLAHAESLQVELKNIQDWQNLAESNPDQLMLWVNLGEAYRRAGRIDEAIEAFNIALSLEPRHLPLQNNLANLYLVSGDTLAAIYHYKSILGKQPKFANAWLNLGVVYASSGKIDEAREAWKKAVKYEPGDSVARAYLAKLGQKGKK